MRLCVTLLYARLPVYSLPIYASLYGVSRIPLLRNLVFFVNNIPILDVVVLDADFADAALSATNFEFVRAEAEPLWLHDDGGLINDCLLQGEARFESGDAARGEPQKVFMHVLLSSQSHGSPSAGSCMAGESHLCLWAAGRVCM